MLAVKEMAAAKLRDEPYKMTDDLGLNLEVMQSGAKWLEYRIAGKEMRLVLNVYPDI